MPNLDFIPGTEEDFNDWQSNFVTKAAASAAVWSIPAGDITALHNEQALWDTAYSAGRPEADPTSSQRAAKRERHRLFEKYLRNFVKQFITNNAAVTNADRVSLGVTVPDTTRTRVAVPGYAPQAQVEKVVHLRHTLRITDPTNPLTRAKPKGVRAARVFRYVGLTPPTDISQYALIGNASRFLFNSDFTSADMGKTAWYIEQYENTRGETGPMSNPVSAVIA